MLMIVMSLAISLVSIPSFESLFQQGENSNQTSQSNRAQQEKKESYPSVLNLPSGMWVQPMTLPPGENAWAVQILSRGGFTGFGRGDLTLSSEGHLTWSGPDGSCRMKLSEAATQALAKVVLTADPSAFGSVGSPTGTCADCYVTALIVQQRAVSGIVRISSASWDDASQEKIPSDVKNIYESLMAQKSCKLQ